MQTISLQELRRRIYCKAKSEKQWRFWGIYIHICRMDTLMESYQAAKRNDGAPGVDGETFEAIEQGGLEKFLQELQQELTNQSYEPQRNRQVEIPKGDGSNRMRKLSIPAIKDRVVQGAMKLILEPIFEADFCDNTYGYRPKRSCAQALYRVTGSVIKHHLTEIIDVDLSSYFDNIRHHILLAQVAKRVNDRKVMRLLKQILKVQGDKGVPQGGPLSTLLANLYLAKVDEVFEEGERKTQVGNRAYLQYTRYVDDIIIAVKKHPRWRNLKEHAIHRLHEELGKLEVKINEDKTEIVDLSKGGKFSYLGFDCQLIRGRKGNKFLLKTPRVKKRKALLDKIKEVIKHSGRQTMEGIIQQINPTLNGWVNYFCIGNSYRTFLYVKTYVESRIRRLAMRRRLRQGFGWKRWDQETIYEKWGLFNNYKVHYYRPPNVSRLLPIRV